MPSPSFLRLGLNVLHPDDIRPYLRLRYLLPVDEEGARQNFEEIFYEYYILSDLPKPALKTYFDLLFNYDPAVAGTPEGYEGPLKVLYGITRRFEASFTSKLVSIHCEERPIYDSRVSAIFGLDVPPKGDFTWRFERYYENLEVVYHYYHKWVTQEDGSGAALLSDFKNKFDGCESVHPHRMLDFCVWSAAGVLGAVYPSSRKQKPQSKKNVLRLRPDL
jgi:hypothetical protein